MRVRCGSCRTQFEVAGAGRFACPVCGSINVVRDAAGGQPAPAAPPSMGGYQAAPGVMPEGSPAEPPPPPREPDPMPKIECPECGHNFIVGMVPTVICPMCSAEVETGIEEDDIE